MTSEIFTLYNTKIFPNGIFFKFIDNDLLVRESGIRRECERGKGRRGEWRRW